VRRVVTDPSGDREDADLLSTKHRGLLRAFDNFFDRQRQAGNSFSSRYVVERHIA